MSNETWIKREDGAMGMKNALEAMFWHAIRGRTQIMWPPGNQAVGRNIGFEKRKRIVNAFNIIGQTIKDYKDKE